MTKPNRDGAENGFGLDATGMAAHLRAYGINPTAQRVEIALVMLSRAQHLSAEDVLRQVNQRNPVVSKATVYNTLGLFTSRGLVRQVNVTRTKVFYDSNLSAHYHLYNIDDGRLTDIARDEIGIERLPEIPVGHCFDSLEVIVKVRRERK